jgi:hypothetical protein
MYLCALLEDAEVRMVGMFAGSWIPAMPNPRVGFIAMPKTAGERRPWRLRMAPLLPNSNVLGKERFLFHIVSILQWKLGKYSPPDISSHIIQYTCRAEIVRWVSESKRPFQIVKDRGFQSLMKTGRPEYHIPSPETVSRDVRNVFVNVRKRIAKMLKVSSVKDFLIKKKTHVWDSQEHDCALNFGTDAWTSPNHKAYVAVTVHFENAGVPVSMLLEIVEVACSHSGFNLAAAFSKILKEFGISDKVNIFYRKRTCLTYKMHTDPLDNL